VVLTPEERRGVTVIVGLLLLGAAYDLWRAAAPERAPAPASSAALDGAPSSADPPPAPASEASVIRPTEVGVPGATGGQRIDLNSADATALDRLPGVGPVLAARIVEHRRAHGPFERVEDLRAVRGIGPRLLERLRPCVRIGAARAARAAPASRAGSAPPSTSGAGSGRSPTPD
jgi:competence ComEA-like helix-hairpin-helix protein